MVIFRIFTVLILAIAATELAAAQQSAVQGLRMMRVRGNVLAIEDSDRVKVAADDGNVYSVTLLGVDAPDENQNYFKKARKRLSELVNGKEVTVMLRTNEQNEAFATIFVGGDDIGLHLIRDGLAWFSPSRAATQNDADQDRYKEAEASAKTAKQGLWDDKEPVAPWTFRGEKIGTTATAPATALKLSSPSESTTQPAPRSEPVPGRAYVLGPRGGCYYLNDQGIKIYVKDKSLCNKPQQ
ncbi:MAG TPA: thermonuclease family protein [Pyrinomonadaceae bacterium]|jgi:endonuclease YncB( thermonuclease family)